MLTFSYDATGKYCICKATVGGAWYCETQELHTKVLHCCRSQSNTSPSLPIYHWEQIQYVSESEM